jgi:hypothetical protein
MDVVEVGDRAVLESLRGSEADLDGDAPDGRRDLDDDDPRQIFAGRIAGQQQNRPPADLIESLLNPSSRRRRAGPISAPPPGRPSSD